MSAATEFARLRRLPAAGAIAYMQARAQLTVTHDWQDLWEDEHASQFTVSRLARLDLLQAVYEGIRRSVQGDLSRRDWMRDVQQLLADANWWGERQMVDPATGKVIKTVFNPMRLALVFDTNLRQAHAAGQWERAWAARRTHPYVRYVTRDDGKVRPQHRAWHNVTLPVDDAFWSEHWPPNGWRCRCRVVSVSRRDYERGLAPDGSALKKERPPQYWVEFINQRTGEVTYTPSGIDPGFAYNAGQARQRALARLQADKLGAAVPALAQAARLQRLHVGLPRQDFTGQRPGLAELPPVQVTQLQGDEFGKGLSHADLMKAATALLQELQGSDGLPNNDTGWLLRLNRKSVKKMGDNMSQSRPSLQAVAALKALVRRAVVVERHADSMHRNEYVQWIYRLAAPALIEGRLYRLKLTVKDWQQGSQSRKLLHALEAVEIESALPGTLLNSPQANGVGTAQPTTGRALTIAELLAGASRNDGMPFDLPGH